MLLGKIRNLSRATLANLRSRPAVEAAGGGPRPVAAGKVVLDSPASGAAGHTFFSERPAFAGSRAEPRGSFLEALGGGAIEVCRDVAGLLRLAGETATFAVAAPFRGESPRAPIVLRHVSKFGVDAVPAVALVAGLAGAALALNASWHLRAVGADLYLANLVGVAVAREIGPLAAAVVVARRAAAAIAREMATAAASGGSRVYEGAGPHPAGGIVAAEAVALLLALPALAALADLCGMAGGCLVGVSARGMGSACYAGRTLRAVTEFDFLTGLAKSAVSRREKVRVGLFFLTSGALTIAVELALAGPWTEFTRAYYATFEESVSGLDEPSPVKYEGKEAGRVTRIDIDPATLRPRVEFEVAAGTPIRTDTVAMLGVLSYASGLRYLELAGGSPKSPARAPGTRIPSAPSTLARLSGLVVKSEDALDSMNRAANALERVAARTDRVIGRHVVAVEEIITDLKTTSRDLAEMAKEIRERPALLIRDEPRSLRQIPDRQSRRPPGLAVARRARAIALSSAVAALRTPTEKALAQRKAS